MSIPANTATSTLEQIAADGLTWPSNPDQILFLGWQNGKKYFSAALSFCVPRRNESFFTSFFTAQAAGRKLFAE